MNRFKLFLFLAIVISAALLTTAAATVWAQCGMASGSKGHACAMQGSAACPMGGSKDPSTFLTPYFEMRSLLANDKVKGLDKLSKNLASETGKFRKKLEKDSKNTVSADQASALRDIEKASSAMKTNNLKSARESFKGLSHSVVSYVRDYGCDGTIYSFYCDMVKESWLQETDKIGNPYYGSQMLKCGVKTGHTMNGKYMSD